MMTKQRMLLLAVLTVMVGTQLKAQSQFALWTDASVEQKLNKQWTLDAGLSFRTFDAFNDVDRWGLGVGTSYRLTKWLKAGVGYDYLYNYNQKLNNSGKKYAHYWGSRHRFNVSLTAGTNFGNLGVSLRERWQYTYRPEQTVTRYYVSDGTEADEHTYRGKGKNVWRQRLQLKYRTGTAFTPYVNAESFVSNGLDKMRYSLGTEIKLSRHHALDLGYKFQDNRSDDDDYDLDRHVLSVGYTYKF